MKPRKRKPGRPRGTTRGGSHVVSFRVNDAQHAELEAEGPTANQAAKRRVTIVHGDKTPTPQT